MMRQKRKTAEIGNWIQGATFSLPKESHQRSEAVGASPVQGLSDLMEDNKTDEGESEEDDSSEEDETDEEEEEDDPPRTTRMRRPTFPLRPRPATLPLWRRSIIILLPTRRYANHQVSQVLGVAEGKIIPPNSICSVTVAWHFLEKDQYEYCKKEGMAKLVEQTDQKGQLLDDGLPALVGGGYIIRGRASG